MARIDINVPPRGIEAVCLEYDYEKARLVTDDSDPDNPVYEEKTAFAKRMCIQDFFKRILKQQEGRKAQTKAYKDAVAKADSEVDIS